MEIRRIMHIPDWTYDSMQNVVRSLRRDVQAFEADGWVMRPPGLEATQDESGGEVRVDVVLLSPDDPETAGLRAVRGLI